jgi:hypothetical protein
VKNMSDVLRLKSLNFTFPSLGASYEDLNLIDGNSVEFRPLVAGDQRHLATVGSDPYKIYQSLLSRVIQKPQPMNVDKLLMSDINALLFAVRIKSFGPEYSIGFQCESCGSDQKQDMSLLEHLQVKYSDEVEGWSAKDLKLDLPMSGKKLTLHLLTLGDEKQISSILTAWQRNGRSKNPDIDRIYLTLAQAIDTIDDLGTAEGKPLFITDKYTIIDNLPIPDAEALSAFVNKDEIGILPTQKVDCSFCSYTNEVALSITPDFFRSSTRVS